MLFALGQFLVLNIEVGGLGAIEVGVACKAGRRSRDRAEGVRGELAVLLEHFKLMQSSSPAETLEEVADIFLGDLRALPVNDFLSPRPSLT